MKEEKKERQPLESGVWMVGKMLSYHYGICVPVFGIRIDCCMKKSVPGIHLSHNKSRNIRAANY